MKKLFIISLLAIMIFPFMTINANAGSSQFLWKPVSESNGKLAVLLPCKFKISEIKTVLIKSNNITENSSSISGPANGDRVHARFPKAGRDYGNGPTVIAVLKSGKQFTWSIPSGANRFESMDQGTSSSGVDSLGDVIGTPTITATPGTSTESQAHFSL